MAGFSNVPGGDSEVGRIQSALVAIAGARGYPDTTLAMVLARSEVSETAFQSHFAGLDEAFERAWAALAAELADVLAEAARGADVWRQRVAPVTMAAAEFLATDPSRARFLVLEVDRLPRTRALRDEYLRHLAMAIDAARRDLGDPAHLSTATAQATAGSLHDLVSLRLRRGGVGEARSLAGELRYVLVMPYWGRRAAEEALVREDP